MGGCIVYTGIMLLLLFVPLFFLSLQFSSLKKVFVPIFSGTVRPRRLKLGAHVANEGMYCVYRNHAAASYSSLYFFIFLSLQFSCIKNFSSEFSRKLWGLEGWNFIWTWTMGSCIVYTEIRMLLLIHPFSSSFFFLSNFQILNIFVTFFSGTVRPRRLKLVTHVNNGWMYHVYQNQTAAAYSFLYSFFFLSNFQTLQILLHFSQELWVLESWNLTHTWTMDGCIVYTANKLLLLLFHPFFFSFFFLTNFQRLKFFITLFSGTVRPIYWKLVTHVDCERMYHLYCCCCLFIPLFLHFPFSPVFKHLNVS